jgi:ABC-2 type transport system ATP-binding protein
MSLMLASELRGRGINVSAIAPGPTATPMLFEGKDQERVVVLLGESAVPFSAVSAHHASLEEAYMELTRDAVEFRAVPAPAAGEVAK